MNIKNKLLAISLLVFGCVFSQEIPVNKYDTSIKYNSFKDNLKSDKTSSIVIGYNKTNYLNASNAIAIEKGELKYQFGATLIIRQQIAKQFLVDLGGFYNAYKTEVVGIANYGGEVSGGIILIPFSLKLTKILQPYAAAGYEVSLLEVTSATNKSLEDQLEGKTTDTSAPIWKAGLMINLSQNLFINAQYKQSLTSKSDRNYNNWSAGLGIKF